MLAMGVCALKKQGWKRVDQRSYDRPKSAVTGSAMGG
jgi:hypothetical protein